MVAQEYPMVGMRDCSGFLRLNYENIYIFELLFFLS